MVPGWKYFHALRAIDRQTLRLTTIADSTAPGICTTSCSAGTSEEIRGRRGGGVIGILAGWLMFELAPIFEVSLVVFDVAFDEEAS